MTGAASATPEAMRRADASGHDGRRASRRAGVEAAADREHAVAVEERLAEARDAADLQEDDRRQQEVEDAERARALLGGRDQDLGDVRARAACRRGARRSRRRGRRPTRRSRGRARPAPRAPNSSASVDRRRLRQRRRAGRGDQRSARPAPPAAAPARPAPAPGGAARRAAPPSRRSASRAPRRARRPRIEDRQAIVGAGSSSAHGGIARNSACVNRTSDAPSTGPIATSTPITITSLGTKASVWSWICVAACRRPTTNPTTRLAMSGGADSSSTRISPSRIARSTSSVAGAAHR